MLVARIDARWESQFPASPSSSNHKTGHKIQDSSIFGPKKIFCISYIMTFGFVQVCHLYFLKSASGILLILLCQNIAASDNHASMSLIKDWLLQDWLWRWRSADKIHIHKFLIIKWPGICYLGVLYLTMFCYDLSILPFCHKWNTDESFRKLIYSSFFSFQIQRSLTFPEISLAKNLRSLLG